MRTGMKSALKLSVPCARFCIGLFTAIAAVAPAYAAVINEIRIAQPGDDNQDYVELAGDPGESLDDLTYLVINESPASRGTLELGLSFRRSAPIPEDGYYLAANGNYYHMPSNIPAGGFLDGDFPTGDRLFSDDHNVTHLLVRNFSCGVLNCRIGSDLDTNDDGILDIVPWTSVVDSVSLVVDPAHVAGAPYFGPAVYPVGSSPLAHVFRYPNYTGPWQVGPYDGTPVVYFDTPGIANVGIPEPTTAALLTLGLLSCFGVRRRPSLW